MGIINLTNACAHLQNAATARLGITSLPNTKYNLKFALALHRAGLVSAVVRAGPKPPAPELMLTGVHADDPVTSANVASRRIWLGLKYWNNEPVMSRLHAYSKPSRPITLNLPGLQRVARGFPQGPVRGLSVGECLFLGTDRGVLEVREALEKRVGGLVLCMVSGRQ